MDQNIRDVLFKNYMIVGENTFNNGLYSILEILKEDYDIKQLYQLTDNQVINPTPHPIPTPVPTPQINNKKNIESINDNNNIISDDNANPCDDLSGNKVLTTDQIFQCYLVNHLSK